NGGITGSLTLDTYGGVSNFTMQGVYTRGNVTAPGQAYEGGLIGDLSEEGSGYYVSTATIQQSYASGTISGSAHVGGLIGDVDPFDNVAGDLNFTLSDSFAAGKVVGDDDTTVGALIGTNQGNVTSSDNYFDETRTGQTACAGSAGNSVTNCTGVDADNTDIRYFFDNHTNHPLDAWDFSNTWVANANDFPSFASEGEASGVSSMIEAAGPNGGDANDDGIPDDQQANVASLIDPVSGAYVALAAPDSCGIESVSVAAQQAQDSGYSYPSGLLNYSLLCDTVGYTAQIKLYIYGDLHSDMVLRTYNPNTHIYATVPDVTLQQTVIGGKQVVIASYQITDGGTLDEDGTANGVIVDPVGLAEPISDTATLTDTGEDITLVSLIAVSLIAAAIFTIRCTVITR
ncbi:MAG TPA: choice-of-anchor U domain-containing protein, partial [Verrucomicrobiae bacterium]|nr:choice-of-anchor U domain-containing protein [Verrucomicrobiae bacterium]